MIAAHPNVIRAAFCAAATCLIALGGCRSQSGMAVNPFLSPDRVPPPATRALLPGQAQPYYPGDPLPVMQSAAPQMRAPAGTALAWNSLTEKPPAAVAKNAAALAFSNESTVAIPADTASLRFAATQTTDNPPPNALAAITTQGTSAPPADQQTIVPAAYYQIEGNGPSTDTQFALAEKPLPVMSPWRSPQVTAPPQAAPVIPLASQHAPMIQHAANSIGVSLRAVPSPATSTSPRIRLPGYAPVHSMAAAPTYGTIVQPAFGGVLQTFHTTPIAPNAFDTRANLAAVPPSAAMSADGFRPRSSMR